MAPSAEVSAIPGVGVSKTNTSAQSRPSTHKREPLKYSGSLDEYHRFDHTPVIGTEFPDLLLADILADDKKLRDLAITVSRRGVVFFRNQEITIDQQKHLAQRLGELGGKPSTSKLNKHPLLKSQPDFPVDGTGRVDDEVSIISSKVLRKRYPHMYHEMEDDFVIPPLASEQWHTDISYERVPSDYAVLHMLDVPKDGCGGDTLWASGYEVYDRLSPPVKNLVDGLNTVQGQASYISQTAKEVEHQFSDRGAPENTSLDLVATHPLIRTNPVTEWRSLYGAGQSLTHGRIAGVTQAESELLKQYFLQLIAQNHDLQVRFRWAENSLAIWDNRCVYHAGTK
ncbi:hypothetical protein PV11_04770 [Exophiala sideris]|uniref:TauD/TfdA-like domain-containing protein n=1 Tax=Exophiala sideris TaxID=1016849 RepID=A0A0D1X4V4_9EURO|nr:hypothetical protein PV11_04770 [Exophiala sideris]